MMENLQVGALISEGLSTPALFSLPTYTMQFTVFILLLLTVMWPASPKSLFCENSRNQINTIVSALKIIRNKTGGVENSDATKVAEDTSLSNMDQMCGLAQRLTNYQVCELDLTPEVNKSMHSAKIETIGLVDNLQMNFKSCKVSTAHCPFTSNLSLWDKISFLLDSWSQDIAGYSRTLQGMCSKNS